MAWEPEGIIIHCAATSKSWMAGKSIEEKRDEIARWHVEQRGWRAIGYAELGDYDGSHAMGRDINGNDDPFDDVGAHTRGWNSKAIGLCLIGGRGSAATDNFEDHFTPEQDAWLRERIAYLKKRYPSIKWVKGHNDFAAKACPGFDVGAWYKNKPAKKPTLVGFVTGSKDAKVVAAVTAVGAANEGLTEVQTLLGTFEEMLGFSPWLLIIGGALLWWAHSRWTKWRKGVV